MELRPLLEIGCEGPLATDGSHLVNVMVGALYRGYLPTLNALINGALGLSRRPLNDLLWEHLRAAPPCSREDMFFVLSEAEVLGLWSMCVFVAFLGVPFAVGVHLLGRRSEHRHRTAEGSQSSPSAPHPAVGGLAVADIARPAALSRPTSLACEPCVPRALAVYYPFGVIAVMVLFLYADLAVGTTVTMLMTADGATSQIGPLFSFSLVSTIAHAWSSGAYFIAVLTLITSGIWPFTKLFILLVAWLVPPRCFSLWRRGKILNFLDAWGKYSFLDSWFLVITLSAFTLEWESLGSASLKMQTTPAAAFYAYLAATVLSLVLGHIASECHHRCEAHRLTVAPKAPDVEAAGAVMDTRARAPRAALSEFAASAAERVIVLGALVTSASLAFVGTFLLSFSFEISGIFTQFLFGRNVERSYSLFSVGMSVASGRYGETGLIGLEMVFVVLAVVVPAALIGLLFSLWLVPMQLKYQKSLLKACRLLDAWSCLDVAALVLAIACFEFGRMAEWLVYQGNYAAPCNMVKNITQEECMKIELHAFPALAALFCAGLSLVVVPKVCLRRFAKAIGRLTESATGVKQQKQRLPAEGIQDS